MSSCWKEENSYVCLVGYGTKAKCAQFSDMVSFALPRHNSFHQTNDCLGHTQWTQNWEKAELVFEITSKALHIGLSSNAVKLRRSLMLTIPLILTNISHLQH